MTMSGEREFSERMNGMNRSSLKGWLLLRCDNSSGYVIRTHVYEIIN